MNQDSAGSTRSCLIGLVAGMSMPGMGQIYNGELVKGLSIFTIYIMTFVTGLIITVYLPDKRLVVGVFLTLGTVLGIYLVSAVEAYKRSSQIGTHFVPKPYNKWYVYLAIWMIGSLLITGVAYRLTRDNVIQMFKIPSESMQPAIMKGDRVIADKTAYRRMPPRKGDIIIFIYKDDRSKFFMKRIAALPGDTLKLPDGKDYTVPHGMVYALGDNPKESVDSRTFGAIALNDVIAKVRQVYYSSGPQGIRWDRIGLTFN